MAGVKGRSGRKPNERFFRSALLNALDEEVKGEADSTVTRMQLVVTKLMEIAQAGDVAAIREIMDRVDGKPKQTHVGGGEEDQPIAHMFKWQE